MVVSPSRKEERKEEQAARVLKWLNGGGRVVVIKAAMLVTLKVQDTERRVVKYTMLKTEKLQELMDRYYDVVCSGGAGGTRGAGRFVFDGKRLKGDSTPEELGMVNGDKIDYFEDLMSG